jgi:hypothetical protein
MNPEDTGYLIGAHLLPLGAALFALLYRPSKSPLRRRVLLAVFIFVLLEVLAYFGSRP